MVHITYHGEEAHVGRVVLLVELLHVIQREAGGTGGAATAGNAHDVVLTVEQAVVGFVGNDHRLGVLVGDKLKRLLLEAVEISLVEAGVQQALVH